MPRAPHTAPLDERFIEERFVRSSGPGGQNINKVATAVELRYDFRAAPLPDDVKERLARLAANRMDADGAILIDSRTFRTQMQNREAARLRLAALIAKASIVPKTRRATAPKAGAREDRLTSKKRRGRVKAARARTSEDLD